MNRGPVLVSQMWNGVGEKYFGDSLIAKRSTLRELWFARYVYGLHLATGRPSLDSTELQWNINWNLNIFIEENVFEIVVWKMAVILFRPQCVKWASMVELVVSGQYLQNIQDHHNETLYATL